MIVLQNNYVLNDVSCAIYIEKYQKHYLFDLKCNKKITMTEFEQYFPHITYLVKWKNTIFNKVPYAYFNSAKYLLQHKKSKFEYYAKFSCTYNGTGKKDFYYRFKRIKDDRESWLNEWLCGRLKKVMECFYMDVAMLWPETLQMRENNEY